MLLAVISCNKSDVNSSSGDGEIGIKVGQIAPGFTLPDKDGNEISLDDYRGNILLIDFWASWCSYCRAENPELVALYADYKDKGFEIIGISIDTDRNNWLKAIDDDGIEYIQVLDQNGFEATIVLEYGVTTIPKMILLDQEGKILHVTTKATEISTVVRGKLN